MSARTRRAILGASACALAAGTIGAASAAPATPDGELLAAYAELRATEDFIRAYDASDRDDEEVIDAADDRWYQLAEQIAGMVPQTALGREAMAAVGLLALTRHINALRDISILEQADPLDRVALLAIYRAAGAEGVSAVTSFGWKWGA